MDIITSSGATLLIVIGVISIGAMLVGLSILIARWAIPRLLRGRRFLAHATRQRLWVAHADAGQLLIYWVGSTTFGAG